MKQGLFSRGRRIGIACLALGAASSLIVAAAGPQTDAGFLWLAESNGVLNVATDDGDVRFEVAHAEGALALAVNDVNGDVWAFASKQLLQVSRTGTMLLRLPTDPALHGGAPAGMVADGIAGNLWLAIKRDLYRFDMHGTLRQTLVLPDDIVGLSLDRSRSRLWLASTRDLRAYDLAGALLMSLEVVKLGGLTGVSGVPRNPLHIQAVAYDSHHDAIWITLQDRVRRYDSSGSLLFERLGAFTGSLAIDGSGGFWLAHDRQLVHFSGHGESEASLAPFGDDPDKHIVDLVADPGDASVWVASRRQIKHYAIDGAELHRVSPDLGDGVIRHLRRAGLYADRDGPELQWRAPSMNALINQNRPVLELAYFDLGVGVDTDSIAIARDGVRLSVSCAATPAGATCTPQAPLPDGQNLLTATIADAVGNVSDPVLLRLSVDTVPPQITVLAPAQDALTNESVVAVRGTVSERASIDVNARPVAITDGANFATEVQLQEGLNTFQVSAIDAAGNTASYLGLITLDTVAPPMPDGALISIGEPGNGHVTVSGATAAAEAGSRIRVTNMRTGQSSDAIVRADGSFAVTIAAEPDDVLTLTSIDGAGNAGPASTVKVPVLLAIMIDEPIDGATVQTSSLLVKGRVKGALNTGLRLNGAMPTKLVEAGVLSFYGVVPLQPGPNTLTATAALADGRALTRSIEVTRVDPALKLTVNELAGLAPLANGFTISGSTGGARFRIDYDFDGNGSIDLSKGTFSKASYTYQIPGIFRPRVAIHRRNASGVFELVQEYVVKVAVFSAAQIAGAQDAVLRSAWTGMIDSLVRGEIAQALLAISFKSRARYGEAFELVAPRMPEIASQLTHIEPVSANDTIAEYAVLNVRNGEPRVHLIGFILGADGVWRIDSM